MVCCESSKVAYFSFKALITLPLCSSLKILCITYPGSIVVLKFTTNSCKVFHIVRDVELEEAAKDMISINIKNKI